MLPLFSYYSLLLFVCYYSMANRKTRRLKKTRKRRGGNDFTQLARNITVKESERKLDRGSTSQAAIKIRDIFAKERKLFNDDELSPANKADVDEILNKTNFSYSPLGTYQQRIVKELKKLMGPYPEAGPKNIMHAIIYVKQFR